MNNAMCDFKSKCATTPCHAEESDRLTKHLLSMHTVEAADSSTPLRSAQNDRAHLPRRDLDRAVERQRVFEANPDQHLFEGDMTNG